VTPRTTAVLRPNATEPQNFDWSLSSHALQLFIPEEGWERIYDPAEDTSRSAKLKQYFPTAQSSRVHFHRCCAGPDEHRFTLVTTFPRASGMTSDRFDRKHVRTSCGMTKRIWRMHRSPLGWVSKRLRHEKYEQAIALFRRVPASPDPPLEFRRDVCLFIISLIYVSGSDGI